MTDCIFCNIVNKTLPAAILLESDDLIVIKDIFPKAPVHLLVVSKKHIASVNDLTGNNELLAGQMILAAKEMAKSQGIAEKGYKLIFNVGKEGGQIVPHVHLHVLGGKKFSD